MVVQVEATDPTNQGVTRVELRINGRTVDQLVSQDPAGETPFSANLSWTPTRVGNVTVSVYAWRGNVSSQAATLTLTVGNTTPTVTLAAGSDNSNFTPSVADTRSLAVRELMLGHYVSVLHLIPVVKIRLLKISV